MGAGASSKKVESVPGSVEAHPDSDESSDSSSSCLASRPTSRDTIPPPLPLTPRLPRSLPGTPGRPSTPGSATDVPVPPPPPLSGRRSPKTPDPKRPRASTGESGGESVGARESITACRYGAMCRNKNPGHRRKFTHPEGDPERKPCKYGLKCFRKQADHLKWFTHPGDADYFDLVRKHETKAHFLTLMDCFKFCDPSDSGTITDKELVKLMLGSLDKPVHEDVYMDAQWEKIEQIIADAGSCSFPQFIEYMANEGINLPLGLSDDEAAEEALECGFQGCPCKCFRQQGEPTPSGIIFCSCGHKRRMHAAPQSTEDVPVPSYWDNTGGDECCEFILCDGEVVIGMQRLVENSIKRTWTRDRGPGNRVPAGYLVRQVFRVENYRLWRKYALKRKMMKGTLNEVDRFETKTSIDWTKLDDVDPVDDSINEWYLWHGTSVEGAEAICRIDFKQRLAGTATGTLYGKGTYFAESITKSDEYAKVTVAAEEADEPPPMEVEPGLYVCLLCRVIGGRVRYTDEIEPDAQALTDEIINGTFDSVLGDREKCRNTFKEFVVFSSDQAYAEYVVYYERVYD